MRLARTLPLLLVALAGLAPVAEAQLGGKKASKLLNREAKTAFRTARKAMRQAESSFRLKLKAFEIDVKNGGSDSVLLEELSLDVAELQALRYEALMDARAAVADRAGELYEQVQNEGGLPPGFAPGAGGAVDNLREKVRRYMEGQRRRILKRFGRARKAAGGKPDLNLTLVLPSLIPDSLGAPAIGGELSIGGATHDLRWLLAGGRGAEGGRVYAGGGKPFSGPEPAVLLRNIEGDVTPVISSPELDEWRLVAGDDGPLLPPGNYAVQLWPDAVQPGTGAMIGLR